MADKVQKILSEITTRKLCTMDEHMAFYNDNAKEDYRFLSEIEEMMTKSIEAVVSQVPCSNEVILYNPSSVDKYYLPQEMNKLGLNKGDKIKIIIIKED